MKELTIPAQEVTGQTPPANTQRPTGYTTDTTETAQKESVNTRPQPQTYVGLVPAAYTVGGVVSTGTT